MLARANSTVGPTSSGPSEGSIDTATDSPSSTSDDAGEEDDYFGDRDDVQSFIQPAISPVATRLTSPRTPAAEKAAAMDRLPGGLTQIVDEWEGHSQQPVPSLRIPPASPRKLTKPREAESATTLASIPSSSHLPVTETAGEIKSPKSAISDVFGGNTRHRRSYSVGENALRRLSRAFPSINLPTSFLPNISTPSFLTGSSSPKDSSTSPQQTSPTSAQHPRPVRNAYRSPDAGSRTLSSAQDIPRPAFRGPPSVSSRRSLALRRSTSEDSILYHSLARVSSFGDDDRFTHVREQVNSRFKAIKDSWDGTSFKMPGLPNILPTPLRKGPHWPSGFPQEVSRSSSLRLDQRASRDILSSLDAVLETLTGDIVIMGGYRGSVLRSSQAPYRQLWVPVKVGLNIRKVNLEVGLDPEDEETMEDTIFSSGMLQNIGPVDISKRLFKKLRECENARKGRLRVHDYGYDWRLSPHILSRKLIEFLEKLPSNHPSTPPEQRGALVIAHSLGGLITRHAVNQRPEIFSGVVFAGTPQRCINILGPLRNGDAVLLNEKVLTAQVNFSMRTTFAMLPEDGFCFIDKLTQEEYPIDFYNVDDWIKYRLSPCVSDAPLPSLPSKSNTFGSLRSISGSLSGLPLRSRASSDTKKGHSPPRHAITETVRTIRPETTGGSLAPQLSSHPGAQHSGTKTEPAPSASLRGRYATYLARTLSETRQFRGETAHRPDHQSSNAYPPLAVVYGKDTPTVWAARVAGRQGIARVDAFDDLVFRSGDGVVLAREAMLPPGYETAKGGRVSSDHGHITMLGDLAAVGRALGAVIRGRRKGIGLGEAVVGKEG